MSQEGAESKDTPFNKLIDIESPQEINREQFTAKDYIEIYEKSQAKKKGNKRDVNKEPDSKKIIKYPVTHLTGFNAARVETTYYDERGKKIAYTRLQKRKPYSIQATLSTNKKKNPNKVVMSSSGKYPEQKQVYYYSNNDEYVYLSSGHDMIRLDWDNFMDMILQCLGHTYIMPNIWKKLLDADYRLQHMSKSPLPHYKLKNWKVDESIIHLDISPQYKEQQ